MRYNLTSKGELACAFGYPWLLHDTPEGCPACNAYSIGAFFHFDVPPTPQPELPFDDD
jgi:hypothetical protein